MISRDEQPVYDFMRRRIKRGGVKYLTDKIKTWIEDFKGKPLKDKLTLVLPYAFSMLFVARIAELYRLCFGDLIKFMRNIQYIYKSFPPRFVVQDLLIGIPIGFFVVYYIKYTSNLHKKNTRFGIEYGSARWGTEKDIKPFIDEDPFNNIILSQTEQLSMKARMPKFDLNRNKHVLVFGGSGAGKTYGFVKPNLYQLHSSYVLTDPKGYI